jgi:2-dehydropantoate 2-reductase
VAKILRRKWLARTMAKFFEPSLRGTYCSMAGEIEKGRTEIENYNGHLLRLAEGKVDSPLNRAVFDLVKRMEADRAQPDRSVLVALSKNV